MSLTYSDRLKELRSGGDDTTRLLALLPWAGLVLALAAFVAELALPLGGGLGACYVLAVLTTFRSSNRYATLAMCALATVLAVVGMLGSFAVGSPLSAMPLNGLVTVGAVWASGAVLLAFSRLSEQLRAVETAAHERQAWLAQTLASIGDGVVACDASGNVEFLNEVAERLTGWTKDEANGRPIETVFDLRHEEGGEPVENPVRRALSAGHIVVLEESLVLNCRGGGSWPLDDSAAPIRDGKGEIIGAVMVFRDISERRKDQQQMELRLREAGHRIRNVFTNVRAILSLCQRGAATPSDLVRCVDKRMDCLLRSTDRLMYASEAGSSAREIIIDEIEPYLDAQAQDRLHLTGDDVLLDASASVSLGMIIHELANNASKHGSLSVKSGRVSIRTRLQDDEDFVIAWQESGGPESEAPGETGLGTQIIGGLVNSQFRGAWQSTYDPDGFSCRIVLPLRRTEND